MGTADARRSLEILRLVAELEADLAVLDRLAQECAGLCARLSEPSVDRAVAALVALDVHRYYTGLEGALERIERLVGALPAAGPAWHRELLAGAARPLGDARPAVLTDATAASLHQLLSFRHFLRHAYSVDLDARRLLVVLDDLARAHRGVLQEVTAFATFLRAMAASFSSSP